VKHGRARRRASSQRTSNTIRGLTRAAGASSARPGAATEVGAVDDCEDRDAVDVGLHPVPQRAKRNTRICSEGCEAVLDVQRHLGIDDPVDQAELLEPAQRLHARRTVLSLPADPDPGPGPGSPTELNGEPVGQ
jgi:hypothetical protein